MVRASSTGVSRSLFLVCLLIASTTLVAWAPPQPLDNVDENLNVVGLRSGQGVVDVPEWAIGDTWTYDSFFDVQPLIASGAPGSQIGTLRGTMTREVTDITTQMVENQSTVVYIVEQSGTFRYNGARLIASGVTITGDLRVIYSADEVVRASDLGQITMDMNLDVDLLGIPFPINIVTGTNLDLATITIATDYAPPKEYYDFPIAAGEYWNSSVTTDTSWSGSVYENLFDLPADSSEQTTEMFGVTAVGNPGVQYSGCAVSLKSTAYNTTSGNVTSYRWFCPNAKAEAWWHQTLDLGVEIDFKLMTYTAGTRNPVISVDTEFPAWPLDSYLGAWVNVSDPTTGSPMGNQAVEFRYESMGDYRSLTTASNGSAYVTFDTGNRTDSSPSDTDYASHGIVGYIAASDAVGVSSIILDTNLVEVDLATLSNGVSVTRTRDAATEQIDTSSGVNAVPGDTLEFSIPVKNLGILSAPATDFEIMSPSGSSNRVSVPSLPALGEIQVAVEWTVPTDQAIGDVVLQFEVDPDGIVVSDPDRSNNIGQFSVFIGRLPIAELAEMSSFYTFTDVQLDATSSIDPDGSSEMLCEFRIEDPLAVDDNDNDPSDGVISRYIYTDSSDDCVQEWYWTDEGEYLVEFFITDDEGDISHTNMTVEVLNRAPELVLASNVNTVPVMDRVTFDAFQHSDVDTMNPEAPVDFLWAADCEEGKVTQVCTVTPMVEGTYTIQATATDDDGAITIAEHSVEVTNIAPWNSTMMAKSANGTELQMDSQMVWHVNEDDPITFTGMAEDSVNDLDTLSYEWWPDVEENATLSVLQENDGASSDFTHAYQTHGMHVIAMEAIDDDGLRTRRANGWLMVQNVPPVIQPFGSLLPVAEDQVLSITGEFQDTASDIETLRACWDVDPSMNSDSQGSAEDDCDVEGADLAWSWPDSATAPSMVVFHVTDDDGERVFEMVNITVRNVKPRAMANVTAPGPYAVGDAIGFSAEGTTDSSLDLFRLKYRWDFNTAVDFDDDGYPANDIQDEGFNVTHVFDEPGTYIVRLTAFDGDEEDVVDIQITVEDTRLLGVLDIGFNSGSGTVVVALGAVLFLLLILIGIGFMRRGSRGNDSTFGYDPMGGYGIGTAPSPQAPPPMHAFAEPGAPSGPPIPEQGLPQGWTMEQWEHFGQEWLDRQAATQSATPPASNPYAPVTSSPIISEPTPAAVDPFAPAIPEVQQPLPKPIPEVPQSSQGPDILDFDL